MLKLRRHYPSVPACCRGMDYPPFCHLARTLSWFVLLPSSSWLLPPAATSFTLITRG